MLTLYFSPGACSLASHIAIEETGVPYEAKLTALAKGEQRTPEYLAINPRARVPALKTEDGVMYLAEAIPGEDPVAARPPRRGPLHLDDGVGLVETPSIRASRACSARSVSPRTRPPMRRLRRAAAMRSGRVFRKSTGFSRARSGSGPTYLRSAIPTLLLSINGASALIFPSQS